MMHFDPGNVRSPGKACLDADLDRYREAVAEVETWNLRVREAKQAADDSLMRVHEARGPHETTNALFVALHEAHQRDRETLFEDMRRLDSAREALGAIERRCHTQEPVEGGRLGQAVTK